MTPAELIKNFPNAIPLIERDGDISYCDRDFYPHCGFMSLREAEILQRAVQRVSDGKASCSAIEIGTHVGWSAAIVALAMASGRGVVTCVDPNLHGPQAERLRANMSRCSILQCGKDENGEFQAVAAKLDTPLFAIERITCRDYFSHPMYPVGVFDIAVIDGDHSDPQPLADAVRCDIALKRGGFIALHDSKGQPVLDAVWFLERLGYRIEHHETTMNGITICWKPEQP